MSINKLFELLHHPLQEEEKELEVIRSYMSEKYPQKVLRFLLRDNAQTDKEIKLFGNNSDEIFTPAEQESYHNDVIAVFQTRPSIETPSQENEANKIQQIYHLYQLIYSKTKHQFSQLAYFYLTNKERPDLTLRIMDVFHQFNFSAFTRYYSFNQLTQFMNRYPVTLDAWQQLLWNNPDSEHALYFLIAPMLEQVLGHPPASLNELDEAWNNIHEKTWPADAWLLLFRFACFVKKEASFVERLSQDNSKILSRDLTTFCSALANADQEIQEQLISKIEPSEVDLSTIPYLQWLFSEIKDDAQRLQLFTKLGIDLIIDASRVESQSYQRHEHSSEDTKIISPFILRNIINTFEKGTFRLLAFRQISEEVLAKVINSPYELCEFIKLFDSNELLDLSKSKLSHVIRSLEFNAYTLARVLKQIPDDQRVAWIDEVLTSDKLAAAKPGPHWNKLKKLFTEEQWSEVRSLLYPGEELAAHFALKSIRAEIKTNSVHFLSTEQYLQNIPKELHESYPLTHANICATEHIIAPPPILEQIHILRAVHNRELPKSQAIEQIKSHAKQTDESLSQSGNPHRQFYSEQGLCFFKTIATTEIKEISEKSFNNNSPHCTKT